MERLTAYDADDYAYVKGGKVINKKVAEAILRLAAYEDTGLEPEEIPHWISVSERMPESGAHVLLCCEVRPSRERYVCDGYYAAPKAIVGSPGDEYASEYDEEKDEYFLLEGFYEVIKNWDDFSSIVIDDFVTHWMPLPQPPKEQL